MNPLWIAVLCVLALLALPTARWVRAARHQWKYAKHIYRAAEADVEAATVFYGSMQLDDEARMLERHYGSIAFHQAVSHELDWREATMAELSPEALDSGPGVAPSASSPGPAPERHTHDGSCTYDRCSVAGPLTKAEEDRLGPASLAIGFLPAPTRLAQPADIDAAHTTHPHPGDGWLDSQLADLFAWVKSQLEAV